MKNTISNIIPESIKDMAPGSILQKTSRNAFNFVKDKISNSIPEAMRDKALETASSFLPIPKKESTAKVDDSSSTEIKKLVAISAKRKLSSESSSQEEIGGYNDKLVTLLERIASSSEATAVNTGRKQNITIQLDATAINNSSTSNERKSSTPSVDHSAQIESLQHQIREVSNNTNTNRMFNLFTAGVSHESEDMRVQREMKTPEVVRLVASGK